MRFLLNLFIFLLVVAALLMHVLGWVQPYAPAASQAASIGNGVFLFAIVLMLQKVLNKQTKL